MSWCTKVQEVLDRDPDAARFISAYNEYAHAIDDIIDEKIVDPEFILKTFKLAAQIYTSNFYLRNYLFLYPAILLAHNMYSDSVILERSNEDWKRREADVLRHSGNEILLAVVSLLCKNHEEFREISLLTRERAYKLHHDDKGEPT